MQYAHTHTQTRSLHFDLTSTTSLESDRWAWNFSSDDGSNWGGQYRRNDLSLLVEGGVVTLVRTSSPMRRFSSELAMKCYDFQANLQWNVEYLSTLEVSMGYTVDFQLANLEVFMCVKRRAWTFQTSLLANQIQASEIPRSNKFLLDQPLLLLLSHIFSFRRVLVFPI